MCNIWYYVQACLPNLRLYRHPSAFQYESNEQTTVGRPCRGVGQDADTRTPEQKKAMLELLTELKKKYPNAVIVGHNTFSNKACPCFDVSIDIHK